MRDEICGVYRRLVYFFNKQVNWGGKCRPYRMFQEARPNQIFLGDEVLYFRCRKDWLEPNGNNIKPANIPFPNQSVNRQKYSKPKDVLLPSMEAKTKEWIFWGVARVFVRDIPEDMKTQGSAKAKEVSYEFCVVHDPENDNYSHSEIRVKKDGAEVKKVNSQKIKKAYRTDLSFKSKIIIKPCV